VHTSYSSYAPTGSLNWTFDSPYPHNVSSEPDIGSDGIHYFVENTIQLFALNTNGSQKWHLTLADYVGGPVVDPQNTQLLLGSAATLNFLVISLRRAPRMATNYGASTCPLRLASTNPLIRERALRPMA
jgi:hypothetical protein